LAASDPDFRHPVLNGRQTYLRPVGPDDYQAMRLLDLGEALGVRWRFRGATPSAEQWAQAGGSQLAHFLIVRRSDNSPIGAATAYQHNFQDQYAYIAATAFNPAERNPLVILGVALFIDYTFRCWNFRKLYMELPAFNLAQFGRGIGRMLVEEARLREHMYYDGRYWDKLILALYRDTWEARSPRIMTAALPRAVPRVTLRVPEDPRGTTTQ
jgi:hypothetical protein